MFRNAGPVLVFLGLAMLATTCQSTVATEAPQTSTAPEAGQPTVEVPLPTQAPVVPKSTETPWPAGGSVDTEARRDNVSTLHEEQIQPLPAPNHTELSPGDGVTVDTQGWAVLRFGDLLTADVLRQGNLVVRALDEEDQSILITLLQRFGAVLNDLDVAGAIAKRTRIEVLVETEFAFIEMPSSVAPESGSCQVLTAQEDSAPVEWVVVLDGPAKGAIFRSKDEDNPRPVPRGEAVWLGPAGSIGPTAPIDYPAVQQWIADVRAGKTVPEFGEVVWPQADVLINACFSDALPEPGLPFQAGGISFTLAPGGDYVVEDCNDDGVEDLAIRSGALLMDFRPLPNRVRAVDVTVINREQAGAGDLAVRDPAAQEVDRAPVQDSAGVEQTLSLRSPPGRPYHTAGLSLENGCFLGISLTPPEADGAAGPPRPATLAQVEPAGQCMPVRTTNLRSGPDTVYPVIAQIYEDMLLGPVAQSPRGDWLLLETAGGEQGYAPLSFLDCSGLRCLPKVTPPPTPRPTRPVPQETEAPPATNTPPPEPTPTFTAVPM